MKKNTLINKISIFWIGIALSYSILFLLSQLNNSLYKHIYLHYSDSLLWGFLYVVFPAITGLAFLSFLKNINFRKSVLIAFHIVFYLQLATIIIFSAINYFYWGYAFKRPTVFKELKNADIILTCSRVTNLNSDGFKRISIVNNTPNFLDHLLARRDLYYGKTARPFMLFQDISQYGGHAGNFSNVFLDSTKKINIQSLKEIISIIKGSRLYDKRSYGNHITGGLFGIITEFKTFNNKKLLFAGLNGGEVSNNHFPFYEFLFIKVGNNYSLVKSQRFYTDLAGLEGLEFSIVVPMISFIISSMLILFLIISALLKRIIKI